MGQQIYQVKYHLSHLLLFEIERSEIELKGINNKYTVHCT